MTSTLTLLNDYLTFDIYIDEINKTNFKQKGCKIIQSGGLKGIVFNFTNDDLNDSFFKIVTGSPNSLNLKAMVKNTNQLNWQKSDQVRVMFLNEIDYRDFEKLLPYFEARLNFYKYNDPTTPGSTLTSYADFSKFWSLINPSNPVDDIPIPITSPALSPKPRQTANDDILTIQ